MKKKTARRWLARNAWRIVEHESSNKLRRRVSECRRVLK